MRLQTFLEPLPLQHQPALGSAKFGGQQRAESLALWKSALFFFFLSSACTSQSPLQFLPFFLCLLTISYRNLPFISVSLLWIHTPSPSIAMSLSYLCVSGFWCLSSLSLVPDQIGRFQHPAKAHSADSPTTPLINHQ